MSKGKIDQPNDPSVDTNNQRDSIYKTLVETSNDCIFVIDKGIIKYTNKKLIELSGFKEEELIGKPFIDFVAPEEKERIIDYYFKRLSGQKAPDRYYSKALIKSGETLEVDVSIVLTTYNNKKLEYVIMHDITELKQVEASLKESKKLYRALHENNPAGILTIGRDYIIKDVNIAACETTGYKREELIGQFCDIVCPKGKQSKECPIWKKGSTGFKGMDTFIKCSDGIKKPIIKNAKVITQEGKDYILETFMDVSEQKRIQVALSESELYYRTIFETTGTATLIVEEDTTIIEANKECEKIIGFKPENLIGKKCIDFFKNEEVKKIINFPKDWNKYLVYPNKHDLRIVDKYGNIRYVVTSVCRIPDTKRIVISVLDITDRKKLEQQYLNAKYKAEESDRLKSAFLANMSHEIRTPMNGILGFSQMLKDTSIDSKKREAFIKIINDCGNQLLSIVNDILDISKIETGELKMYFEEININSLITEQFELFLPKADENKLRFNYNLGLESEKSIVLTDYTRVCQIISNLINNAIKFTNKGSIEFGYELSSSSSVLRFYVKDTGTGIPNELKDKIFDRFIQVEQGNRKQYRGNGLGLAISKKLVELLGGKIWVESKPGVGSTFYFTIPYTPIKIQHQNDLINKSVLKENKEPTYTILVVEDEESNYLYIKEVLSSFNINIIHAQNGKESIEYCELYPEINLVLMDIKMPVMSGIEATRQIKLIRPNLPVIALTAYAMFGDRDKALQQGFDDYFTKPIKKEEIKNAINKHTAEKIKSNLN